LGEKNVWRLVAKDDFDLQLEALATLFGMVQTSELELNSRPHPPVFSF
jgi:hypothetical protein